MYGGIPTKSTFMPNKHIAVVNIYGYVYIHDTKEGSMSRFKNDHEIAGQTGLCVGPDECFLLCGKNVVVQASTSGKSYQFNYSWHGGSSCYMCF